MGRKYRAIAFQHFNPPPHPQSVLPTTPETPPQALEPTFLPYPDTLLNTVPAKAVEAEHNDVRILQVHQTYRTSELAVENLRAERLLDCVIGLNRPGFPIELKQSHTLNLGELLVLGNGVESGRWRHIALRGTAH